MIQTETKKRYIRADVSVLELEQKQKVFFPNLDALRFICFLMVFLFHVQKTILASLSSGSSSSQILYSITAFLFQNGELGVNFFFVLSGFLITYLLLKEKAFKHTINLRNFYIRRMLRIWPLFYLCVFIGFVLTPLLKGINGEGVTEIAKPLYYLFFINNFDYIQGWPSFPDALILIVLWSVAVEEQFYIAWPLIIKNISIKRLPLLFIGIILATLIFRSFYTDDSEHAHAIRNFHTLAVIGDMALGGLFAYYCSFDTKFLRFICKLKKWQIYFIYACAISVVLFRHQLFTIPATIIFERLIIAAFFGLIILEQNFTQHSLFKFSKLKRLSKLGLYTYGLYCLHFFIISLMQSISWKLGIPLDNAWLAFGIASSSLLLTIVVCYFSYIYFERPFLLLKDRFSYIVKG